MYYAVGVRYEYALDMEHTQMPQNTGKCIVTAMIGRRINNKE
jgi:hypothetical protein